MEAEREREREGERRESSSRRQETGILNGETLTRGNEHSAIRLAPSGIVHIKSALFECQKYPGTGDSVSGWIGTRETREEIQPGIRGLDFQTCGVRGISSFEFLRADTDGNN